MSNIVLSVIVPARNEFPQVVMTFYSILHCWEADGFPKDQIEIIIVNNCSDDFKFPQRGTGGTTDYLMTRGAYWSQQLRVLYDPIAGNHSARNKGAEIARGKYVFFSDAHMAYKPGFFREMIKAVDESGGIAHGAIGWMGANPYYEHGLGYQYSLKLGEEIKGTWAPYKVADDWFYIAAQGHCSVMVRRDQFLKFGGYPKVHRTYGGGEFYLDIKWWMLGSSVVAAPKAWGFHLASGRGYSYNHDREYIHNLFNIGYALGMDDWLERAFINYARNKNVGVLKEMMAEAKREMEGDRKFIEKHRKMTFNELIKERLWDKKNDERHGNHFSGLTIFHDTWLPLIKGTPAEQLYPGEHQLELEKFINENLSEFVYKRK